MANFTHLHSTLSQIVIFKCDYTKPPEFSTADGRDLSLSALKVLLKLPENWIFTDQIKLALK